MTRPSAVRPNLAWLYLLVVTTLCTTGAAAGEVAATSYHPVALPYSHALALCARTADADPGCAAGPARALGVLMLAGSALLLGTATGCTLLIPLATQVRLRRHRRLRAAPDPRRRFAELCAEHGLTGPRQPRLLIAGPAVRRAFTTAVPGWPATVVVPATVVLPAAHAATPPCSGPVSGPASPGTTDFDQVVRRELAHVVAGDASLASALRALTWLAVPAIGLAGMPALSIATAGTPEWLRAALLAAVTALLAAGLLRLRDNPPDTRADHTGPGSPEPAPPAPITARVAATGLVPGLAIGFVVALSTETTAVVTAHLYAAGRPVVPVAAASLVGIVVLGAVIPAMQANRSAGQVDGPATRRDPATRAWPRARVRRTGVVGGLGLGLASGILLGPLTLTAGAQPYAGHPFAGGPDGHPGRWLVLAAVVGMLGAGVAALIAGIGTGYGRASRIMLGGTAAAVLVLVLAGDTARWSGPNASTRTGPPSPTAQDAVGSPGPRLDPATPPPASTPSAVASPHRSPPSTPSPANEVILDRTEANLVARMVEPALPPRWRADPLADPRETRIRPTSCRPLAAEEYLASLEPFRRAHGVARYATDPAPAPASILLTTLQVDVQSFAVPVRPEVFAAAEAARVACHRFTDELSGIRVQVVPRDAPAVGQQAWRVDLAYSVGTARSRIIATMAYAIVRVGHTLVTVTMTAIMEPLDAALLATTVTRTVDALTTASGDR